MAHSTLCTTCHSLLQRACVRAAATHPTANLVTGGDTPKPCHGIQRRKSRSHGAEACVPTRVPDSAKLDVPLLVAQLERSSAAHGRSLPPTDFVLYTDLDVFFVADPARALRLPEALPHILAAVPDLIGYGVNTGVLWINTSGLAEHHQGLVALGVRRAFNFNLMEQTLVFRCDVSRTRIRSLLGAVASDPG